MKRLFYARIAFILFCSIHFIQRNCKNLFSMKRNVIQVRFSIDVEHLDLMSDFPGLTILNKLRNKEYFD